MLQDGAGLSNTRDEYIYQELGGFNNISVHIYIYIICFVECIRSWICNLGRQSCRRTYEQIYIMPTANIPSELRAEL
jgi:hypothetical protein